MQKLTTPPNNFKELSLEETNQTNGGSIFSSLEGFFANRLICTNANYMYKYVYKPTSRGYTMEV